MIATSFTHFTSRADDPQLHDHVVIWNRARSVSDGRWRTLDSKAIFKATTTLSELHQGVLSDLLTSALGVGWEARGRRHSAKPRYEITGVAESAHGRVLAPLRADRRALRAPPGRVQSRPRAKRHRRRGHEVARGGDDRHPAGQDQAQPRRAHGPVARTGRESYRQRTSRSAWVSSLKDRNDLPLLTPRRPRRGDPCRCRRGGRHNGRRAPFHLRPPEPSRRGPPHAARGSLRFS